jgi:hypothetical protein
VTSGSEMYECETMEYDRKMLQDCEESWIVKVREGFLILNPDSAVVVSQKVVRILLFVMKYHLV